MKTRAGVIALSPKELLHILGFAEDHHVIGVWTSRERRQLAIEVMVEGLMMPEVEEDAVAPTVGLQRDQEGQVIGVTLEVQNAS